MTHTADSGLFAWIGFGTIIHTKIRIGSNMRGFGAKSAHFEPTFVKYIGTVSLLK